MNIELVSALGFAIGCALAGAAGALLAPVFSVSPTMGALPVVKAFIIIIVGGMGSLPGAVLGGLLLGAVEGVGTLFMSSAAVNILGFLMVIAILLAAAAGAVRSEPSRRHRRRRDCGGRGTRRSRWWAPGCRAAAARRARAVAAPSPRDSYHLDVATTVRCAACCSP